MKSLLALTALLLAPALSHAYTFDSDVPQAVKDQITNDMAFIKTIQGTARRRCTSRFSARSTARPTASFSNRA